MNSKTFFISPTLNASGANNYLDHFFESLNERNKVLNFSKRSYSRSLDMLRYGYKADVMVLHWPEDVVSLNFGALQAIFSVATISMLKLIGKQVIWFCHNKQPHNKKNKWLNNLLRSFYKKISNLIIVHSSDALNYMPASKTFFLPHPAYVERHKIKPLVPEQYNVLIWGNIYQYKGLDEFIDSYKHHDQNFSVLIIGRADKDFYKTLCSKAEGTNITIADKFLSDDDLRHYFQSAKMIVLPYLNSDTFCSGALIHSLNSGKIVIGPRLGNFVDVQNDGACLTYKDHQELFDIINKLLHNPLFYGEQLIALQKGMDYYKEINSWDKFITGLISIIDGRKPSHNSKTYTRIKKFLTRKATAKEELI